MKNKSFTLLELVVVILIIGVLATLGFTQYGRMVEKARGAEARAILGDTRKLAVAYYLANGTFFGLTEANVNIGTSEDQIPYTCRSSHYFRYQKYVDGLGTAFGCLATRCASGGKSPQGSDANSLYLRTSFVDGSDTWTIVGGY